MRLQFEARTIAGMMAKYLAMSLAIEKIVSPLRWTARFSLYGGVPKPETECPLGRMRRPNPWRAGVVDLSGSNVTSV